MLFLCTMKLVYAQTDFQPGFVVTNSFDTLYGEIDYRSDQLMGAVCKFRKPGGKEATEYKPGDIHGYRFIDSKHYITKEVDNQLVFLEFLINGEVDIYYLRNDEGDHYFIDKEGVRLSKIPYEEGIVYQDGKHGLYKSTKHINLINAYMGDAPGLYNRILEIGKPDHQNLIELAQDYHNIVCSTYSCIVYEKKIPRISLSIEPVIGFTKYKDLSDAVVEFGAILYIWAPRTSERLYFKTGLLYHRLTEAPESPTVYKIPLQIQYLYPGKKLQPNVSLGMNYFTLNAEGFKDYSHTITLNGGVNYKIHNGFGLSLHFNSDYTPFSYTTEKDAKFGLVSYSALVGVLIAL